MNVGFYLIRYCFLFGDEQFYDPTKATSEIPLLQDTLCHLFVIGISKQYPINGRDVIDLIDFLVKRAAGLHPLIADDFQVSDSTFLKRG